MPSEIITLAALAALVFTAWVMGSRVRPTTKRLLAHGLVINLKNGTAVFGVCIEQSSAGFVLAEAQVLEPGAPAPTPADGAIVIDRAEVAYIQTTTAPPAWTAE